MITLRKALRAAFDQIHFPKERISKHAGLILILSEKRRMKPLSLNGVMPSPQAIAEGAYPYFKRYHMVTGPKKPSALVQQFIAFVRPAEGSKILTRTGHWVVRSNDRVAQDE